MKRLYIIPLILIVVVFSTLIYVQYLGPYIDSSAGPQQPAYSQPTDYSGDTADTVTPVPPAVSDSDTTAEIPPVVSSADTEEPAPEEEEQDEIPADAYEGIAYGSRGDDVTRLQTRLIELGYLADRADGIFGRNTERAVMSFQQTSGLAMTGTANRYTEELLYSDSAPSAPESVDHEDVLNPTYNTDYYIIVYLDTCTVRVLGKDAFGHYNQEIKVFTCSVGLDNDDCYTPSGLYKLGDRYEWCKMVDDSYGQYAIRYDGSYMIHSVPYNTKSAADLKMEEYEKLGEPASHGCIRLCAGDIKWLYDNAARYTQLHIIDGKEGPAQPAVTPLNYEAPYNGWDPTDPAQENPYN